MAGAAKTMDVNIVAEDRPLWAGKVVSAVVPSLEGYMGILPGHEPLLALVGTGDVQLTDESGEVHTFAVDDGFISFEDDTLTIGVDQVFS